MTSHPTSPARPETTRRHAGLAVLALAMGGFVIGTTEFVTMGLLPQVAVGVDVTIPQAGHIVSAYALGVVVGAPVLAFATPRLPRRGLLLALVGGLMTFNAASAVAPTFVLLVVARFLAGFPHGAYFGVASLVAASLAPPHRRGRAVALVLMGLAVANVVGVPAATWLGQLLGWRAAYWVVTGLALVTLLMIAAFVPSSPGDPTATGRRELAALRQPQVQLTLLAGAIGFGGFFAVYSYIAPVVTEVAGLHQAAVPVFLLAFGLGMVGGNWLAGELADWSVMRSLLGSSVAMAVVLLVFGLVIPYGWWALPVAFAITVVSSVLALNLQLRLMHVAGEAQMLGAAMNHSSLNLANALGAWLGGLVIAAGFGYRSPTFAGVVVSLAGVLALLVSAVLHLRTTGATGLSGPARPPAGRGTGRGE